MIEKNFRLLFIFTIVALLLFSSATVFAAQNTKSVKRLSGDNRYGTSAEVALSKWTQSDYVILAFGEDFPDALSAAPLAKKYDAPILLTETNYVPAETLSAIKQLKAKNVIIVGGTGVISSAVEKQLNTLGITVSRISGQDRYETGIKIAEQLDNVTEIAIVTGESFADALSISSIAAKKNMPIILVPNNAIPSVVMTYISSHNLTKTYVIGSGTSLNNAVLTGLSNIQLITGNDKYQINLNIIDKFKSDLDLSTIYLATGENFADALSGSALAGINSNPLLLIGNDTSSEKDFFNNNSSVISNISILGGIGAVTDNVVNKLIGGTAPSAISVVSKIEFVSNNLTKIGANTATFNYKLLDINNVDITKAIPTSQINAVASVSSSINLDSSTGTGTIIYNSSSNIDKSVVVTLVDLGTGIVGTSTFNSESSALIPTDIGNLLPVAKIDFLSTKLIKTGANTAIFKYDILDKVGNDITKTVPTSSMITSSFIDSSVGRVSLDPSTGVGTVTYNFSDTVQSVSVQLGYQNGIVATATLFLVNMPEDSSVVDKINFTSRKLTTIGSNQTTFAYFIVNKSDIVITKKIPATQIEAAASINSTITLDPSTATGTITYNSATDVNKPITISLKDKLTGINVSEVMAVPEGGNLKVTKIDIDSTQLSITTAYTVQDQVVGYAKYTVLDQQGNDITNTSVAANVTFNCTVGTITAYNGLLSLRPNAGVDLSTLKSVLITGSDSITGVSTSATLSIK